MKKFTKWFLRIAGILFLLIIIAIIVIPLVFKDQIIKAVKDEVNKNLNAKVDFGKFSFSIIKSFPDLILSIDSVSVEGTNEFKGDTLFFTKELYLKIDILSLFGDKYEIKSIELNDPKVLLKVLKGGKANWDITKPTTDTISSPEDTVSSFKLGLKKLKINNLNLKYIDEDSKIYAEIIGMNHFLSGDFTSDVTDIKTNTEIKSLSLNYEGIQYMKNNQLDFKAEINADLKNSKYTFKQNELRLNELYLEFDGYTSLHNNDDIELDIKFQAKRTEFKNILSLIPAIFMKDFANIKTSGNISLNGFARGIYNEKTLPSFELNVLVDNAMFQYPSLPQSVKNIAINTKISNKGGSADNTVIDIKKFHFNMAENPFEVTLLVTTPVSDPNINAKFRGKIDLSKIKQVYPLDANQKLNGILEANLSVKGKLSSLEKQQFNDFEANGKITLSDMNYSDKDFPEGISIKQMILSFSPQVVNLENFTATLGKNDINANGRIDNFYAYLFKNEKLKGEFNFTSEKLDLNDFMKSETTTTSVTSQSQTSEPTKPFEIPANIDFTLKSKIKWLKYDNIEIHNIDGTFTIKEERANMENLKMSLLDGTLTLNGYYDSKNIYSPEVDFSMDLNNWDITKTFNTFNTIKQLAPIGEHCQGKFSSTLKFSTKLDQTMTPILNSINAKGTFKTNSVAITNSLTMNKIADALKMDQFRKLALQNVNIAFLIKDGKVEVEPFNVKIDQIKAKIGGKHYLDQTIDYRIDMEIPTAIMGNQAKSVVSGLITQFNNKTGTNVSLGNTANITAYVTGTVKDPQVKTGIKEAVKETMNETIDELKQRAQEEINRKKEELENKAREEAEKLKKEAEEKAREEAERLKKEAEEKAKKEADKLKKDAEEKVKDKIKKLLK